MNNTISVSRAITKVILNENGDFIELNMDDQALPVKLADLAKVFEYAARDFEAKCEEVGDGTGGAIAAARLNLEICENLQKEIDAVLGEGVCRKVFGSITPGISAYVEFFSQLQGIMDAAGEERRKRIEKYTAKYAKYRK